MPCFHSPATRAGDRALSASGQGLAFVTSVRHCRPSIHCRGITGRSNDFVLKSSFYLVFAPADAPGRETLRRSLARERVH